MKAKKLLNHIKIPALIAGLALPALVACQQDDMFEDGRYTGEPQLEFKGSVAEAGVPTRALSQTPVNVEPNEFDGYFYIQVNDPTYQPEGASQPEDASKFGYYKVPPDGSGGVLRYAGTDLDKKPNWFTIDDDHYFWSWTLPWTEAHSQDGITIQTWGDGQEGTGIVPSSLKRRADGEGDDDGDGEGEGGEEPRPSNPPVDPEIYLNTNPIKIKLQNTSADEFTYTPKTETEPQDSSWNYGSWGNGYFFEKFVGAKSGPYDFRRNGVEVPLQFRHLMSKISVRSLLFYRANGNTEEDKQANITFINMPTQFTFYPHPTQDDVDANPDFPYIKAGGPPIVVPDYSSATSTSEITYGFTNPIDLLPEETMDNKAQFRDKFYICPEVDFSKVAFKIEILGDPGAMSRGEYYGDFSSVAFERDPKVAPDYDNPNGETADDYVDDTKVLHAGETMYFDLIVREYGGGGYTIYVRNWSTRPEQKTKHYPHPGIYVDGEAVELIGTGQTWDAKYDLYGDGFLDGESEPDTPQNPGHLGVFHQYNDIDMGNRTSFPIDPNYVLNGMGHILEFKPTSDTTTVTIGKMIDIYISINGVSVYIDEEGWIYTFNPTTGKYEITDNQLPLDGTKTTWTLNVATGQIS